MDGTERDSVFHGGDSSANLELPKYDLRAVPTLSYSIQRQIAQVVRKVCQAYRRTEHTFACTSGLPVRAWNAFMCHVPALAL